MAKKIEPQEGIENNTTETNLGNKSEEITTEKNEPSEVKELEPTSPINQFIEGILKTYASYEFLYIDDKGGVFTTNTQEKIRGNAALYKNPFYNSNTPSE